MKKPLIIILFLSALLAAGCSDKSAKNDGSTLSQKAGETAEQVKDTAVKVASDVKTAAIDAKDAVAAKIVEWKLTPDDIKADFEKSGRVVREKSVSVGAKSGEIISDARIVTVINGKLLAAADLSVFKINVDADKGVVSLTGSVKSHALIGRAIALALDTDGVTQVVSLLTVEESVEPKSM
ncbi:MAG: BON domain-containing protein [Opitutaceae bacterium]|jgi:osmotically-inducible protein OsmY